LEFRQIVFSPALFRAELKCLFQSAIPDRSFKSPICAHRFREPPLLGETS